MILQKKANYVNNHILSQKQNAHITTVLHKLLCGFLCKTYDNVSNNHFIERMPLFCFFILFNIIFGISRASRPYTC